MSSETAMRSTSTALAKIQAALAKSDLCPVCQEGKASYTATDRIRLRCSYGCAGATIAGLWGISMTELTAPIGAPAPAPSKVVKLVPRMEPPATIAETISAAVRRHPRCPVCDLGQLTVRMVGPDTAAVACVNGCPVGDIAKRWGLPSGTLVEAAPELQESLQESDPGPWTCDPGAGADGPERARRMTFSTVGDLLLLPPPAWRVVGAVPDAGIGVVWGGPGSGKTFGLLDLCLAVARGIRWQGRRVKRCGVAYIATEGALRNRVAAYLAHNHLEASDLSGFRVLHSSVDLLHQGADLNALTAALRDVAAEIGSLGIVVIDTLNRAMPGGNENAAEDMGAMVAAAQRIATEIGCLVIYVHHSGKDESRGGRGHSSLKGAIDFELAVKRDAETDIRTLVVEKLRDGRDGETLMAFKLLSVDLGAVSEFDPDADPWELLTSCVVEPCDAPLPAAKEKARGAVQRAVVTILWEGPVLKADLIAKLEAVGHGRSSAYAAINKLAQDGDIEVGFDKRFRVTPIKAAEECPNVQNSPKPYKTGQGESGCKCPIPSSVSIDTGRIGQTGHPRTPKPDSGDTTEDPPTTDPLESF